MEERAYAEISPEPEPEPEPDPFDAPLPRRGTPTLPLWRRRPVQLLAATAGIAAVGIGAWFAGRGSANSAATASPSPSPKPSQIEVLGTLTIPFLGTDLLSPNARDTAVDATSAPAINDPCVTLGGYNDISQGTAVTIGGAEGQTLAIGPLGAGRVYGQPGKPASCRFAFSISVPAGQGMYTVTISHRGTQTFTPEQVADGIDLTLGG